MTIAVVLVDVVVVIDPIFLAGVVRWIDVDALDPVSIGHAQPAQRVEIVALDHQIAPRLRAVRKCRINGAGNKICIDGRVGFDLVPLPHEPQLLFGVFFAQKADQLGLRKRFVMIGQLT